MKNEGLADVAAGKLFRLPRLHPGIGSLPSVGLAEAVLIPRPRINLTFYHGVLAPHCQLASTYGLCSLRACLRGGMCHGPERTIEAVATGGRPAARPRWGAARRCCSRGSAHLDLPRDSGARVVRSGRSVRRLGASRAGENRASAGSNSTTRRPSTTFGSVSRGRITGMNRIRRSVIAQDTHVS